MLNFFKRPFISAGVIGLIMLMVLLVFIVFFPTKPSLLPKGFFTPIIAFEFIQTPQEVDAMFKAPEGTVRQGLVDSMNTITRPDFIYGSLFDVFAELFGVGRKTFGQAYFSFRSELFAISVGLVFLLMVIYCFITKTPWIACRSNRRLQSYTALNFCGSGRAQFRCQCPHPVKYYGDEKSPDSPAYLWIIQI